MDDHEDRITALEQELSAARRDLSFLARHLELSRRGHATITEYERFSEILARYPRWATNARP